MKTKIMFFVLLGTTILYFLSITTSIPISNKFIFEIDENHENIELSVQTNLSYRPIRNVSYGTIINIELHSNIDFQNIENKLRNESNGELNDDDIILLARKKIKNYYYGIRARFYYKYTEFETKQVYESSPFISLIIPDTIISEDSLTWAIKKYSADRLVKNIYISPIYQHSPSIDPIECLVSGCTTEPFEPTLLDPSLHISYALDTVNLTNYVMNNYNGNQVIIGIHEAWSKDYPYQPLLSGLVDKYSFAVYPRDVQYYDNQKVERSHHATLVAAIAAGNYGVARGSSLLSTEVTNNSSLYDFSAIDWQVEQNVNVINLSFNMNLFDSTSYKSLARKYDKYAYDNNVLFVFSAGNGTTYNSLTFPPANGNNVITVGGTNISGTLRNISSRYGENNTYDSSVQKPTLVAPGILWVPFAPQFDGVVIDGEIIPVEIVPSGTSFAAPLVTGIIALGMQANPLLKLHPELVHSLITSTANMNSFYYYDFRGGLEDQVGAGLVDAQAFINAASSNQFFLFNNNINYPGTVANSGVINVTSNQTIKISAFWYTQVSTNLVSKTITPYTIRLETSNGVLIDEMQYDNNLLILEHTFTQSQDVIIKIVLNSNKTWK
jgi:hypothetical protein